MRGVTFTREAEADLGEIDDHTLQNYGLERAIELRESFENVLLGLRENPRSAPRRPGLDPPGKSFRYRVWDRLFVIVYEAVDDGIRVVRVIHGARNLAAELTVELAQEG